MKISEFARRRIEYEERARRRLPERIDDGSAGDEFRYQVIEEMLIDWMELVDKLKVASLFDRVNALDEFCAKVDSVLFAPAEKK